MVKIRLTEKQLKDIIMSEMDGQMNQDTQENDYHNRGNRYMFFSNLQQMKRQCEMLLNLDVDMIALR